MIEYTQIFFYGENMISDEKVVEFIKKQNSIDFLMDKFIDDFIISYEDADQEEKGLLEKNLHQIFRRFYYSQLLLDEDITMAMIVAHLVEKEFGKDLQAVPSVRTLYKNGSLVTLEKDVRIFRKEEHPFVKDMEIVLEVAESGIRIDQYELPDEKSCKKFVDRLSLRDKYYFNVLFTTALSLDLMVKLGDGKTVICKTSSKAAEFLSLSGPEKLVKSGEGILMFFSKQINENYPELSDVLSYKKLLSIFTDPSGFRDLIESALDELEVDASEEEIFKLAKDVFEGNKFDIERIKEFTKILNLPIELDMYMISPLSYYLQFISPVYLGDFDVLAETDLILGFEDVNTAFLNLFTNNESVDLTSLGEVMLDKESRPERGHLIDPDATDEDLLGYILQCQEIIEDELEDLDDFDYFEE
jgi:hypothetical protein